MKLVIDTNILISSIINPSGKNGEIILNPLLDLDLYSCYFLHIEILKYKNKLLKASKLNESEFLELAYYLFKKIKFINEEHIPDSVWRTAFEFTKDIDEKDTPFVALSLFLKATLWTGDKQLSEGLTKKSFKSSITTNQLILGLNG